MNTDSVKSDAEHPLPYIAVLAMLVAAISMRTTAVEGERATPGEVERLLERELSSRVGAVLQWERHCRLGIEALADDFALTTPPLNERTLGSWLSRACADPFEGCVVLSRSGAVLASVDAPPAFPDGLVSKASAGRSVQSKLFERDAVSASDTADAHRSYGTFFASPLVRDDRVVAVVGGFVPLGNDLAQVLGARPLGRTGETYAVAPDGLMITRSRFAAQALRQREHALRPLPAPGGVQAVDAGHLQRPAVPVGLSGTRVDGYLDYRGVPVVGAWRWLDELGTSIVTEMDVAEAFAVAGH